MELEFVCPECRKSNRSEISVDSPVRCASCDKTYRSLVSFCDEQRRISSCGICGCRDLYVQKDFSRKVGCAIAAIGAILAPFTKLISLFVCALIDLLLYRSLPMITICYRCHSIYRDFPANPSIQPFNLGINDRYRAGDDRKP